jgi:hypothetical protein
MEAISVLIANSAVDCKPLLVQLMGPIVERLERTFSMQDFDASETEKKEQMQGLLCAIIQVLYQKIDKETMLPMTDKIMEQLLHVLQTKNSSCHEETFSSVAAVADLLEGDFAVCRYIRWILFVRLSRDSNRLLTRSLCCFLYRNTCLLCSHS